MQYGSNQFKPLEIARTRVGRKEQKTSIPITSLLRIFVTIAEVGLSLIPGLGPGALVGIGLGAAVANTAISQKEGNLTGIGLLFDFAAPIVGTVGMARNVAKFSKRIADTEELQQATLKTLKEVRYAQGESRLSKIRTSARYNETRWIAAKKKATGMAYRINHKNLLGTEEAILEYIKMKDVIKQGVKFNSKKNYLLRKLAKKYDTTLEAINKEIKEMTEAFETIKSFTASQKLNKSRFASEIKKVAPKGHETLFNDIFLPRRKEAIEFSLKKIKAKKVFEDATAKMSKKGQKLTNQIMSNIRYLHKTPKEMDEIVELMLKKLSARDQAIFSKNIEVIFDSTQDLFRVFARQSDVSRRKAWIKYMGSSRFNEKIVQRAQLIDPNDIGRAVPELLYKKFKRKFEKYFEKSTLRIAGKKAANLLVKTEKLMDAWRKSGGVRFPMNRYIIGMKEIVNEGARLLVLIKFNKLTTAGKTGKNVGGKKDILVVMSVKDFKRLETEGVRYWNRVSVKKGWAVSHGGRRARVSASTVSNELSLFLGFIPIPALRNTLSIVSNWVENIASLSRGKYFKGYIAKIERAFIRTSINRSARLGTRVVIGGALGRRGKIGAVNKIMASKSSFGSKAGYQKALMNAIRKSKRSSSFVGRELQRAATITLSTFEGKTSGGYFKFTKGGTRSKSAGRVISEKYLTQGMPTSVKSSLLRTATHKKRTGGKMLLGSRRKLGQAGRVYSAFTPSGTKSLRSLTRFK